MDARAVEIHYQVSGFRALRTRDDGLPRQIQQISTAAIVRGHRDLAFAGGAILTMLADTLIPEAFENAGNPAGLATTLGFGLAFALSLLD